VLRSRLTTKRSLWSALKKNGVARSEAVVKTLEQLDRKWFTDDPLCYNNKPSAISNRENMTDAFTHALTLQSID
jgi:protein-L-isoaspartate O-methyltransferase